MGMFDDMAGDVLPSHNALGATTGVLHTVT